MSDDPNQVAQAIECLTENLVSGLSLIAEELQRHNNARDRWAREIYTLLSNAKPQEPR
jgi:hypothetical protein